MKPQQSFRHATPVQLAEHLQDARNYTLAMFEQFSSVGLDDLTRVPHLKIINPPLWELGHIAWFSEWFVLREAATRAAFHPSLLKNADAYFDSGAVAHDTRWSLNLPDTKSIKNYCKNVLECILEKLTHTENNDTALYPFRLVLAHEDMHGEAFLYTLQTLGLATPSALLENDISIKPATEIHFSGGEMLMGSAPDNGFVFDNEKWAHRVIVPPFSIDSSLVTNQQFSEFIAAGGYEKNQYWSGVGWAWRKQNARTAPRYWKRDGGNKNQQWQCLRFGETVDLPPDQAVRHVNLYEAQAYCAWANRRLPTETEWEFATHTQHTQFNSGKPLGRKLIIPAQAGIQLNKKFPRSRQYLNIDPLRGVFVSLDSRLRGNDGSNELSEFHWGALWEWTQSPFAPYSGFSADAYQEYSAPWFYTHQVLRGASFATQARMRAAAYRNFYTPERDDIFVGFRTCGI